MSFKDEFAKRISGEFRDLDEFKEWINDDGYPYNEDICKFALRQEGLCESFSGTYEAFYDFYMKFVKTKKER